MLLILMYHQIINSNNLSNALEIETSIKNFENHLLYLKENFNIIIPGQTIFNNKISVCLTFDDVYVDVYHYIYPLLKKHNISAVLAIPAGLIENNTELSVNQRLDNASYSEGLNENQSTILPLCTWEEIRVMVRSGLLVPASHSLNHKNLKLITSEDAYQEICISKRMISVKLETIAEVFIYPFGAYTKRIQEMVKAHYRYIMRIGEASNADWEQNMLYRVNADPFWRAGKKFSFWHLLAWKIKYYLNKIRNK